MTPPRLARALLALILPADVRDAVLTDLDEEYLRHVRPSAARIRAAMWYWRQALGSIPAAVRMRRRRRQEVRLAGWAEGLLFDIRYAARFLVRRPGFAAAAIGTLALGIGANTAIFSIVDGVILKPLPYHDADRLVRIWSANPRGIPRNAMSPADFFDLRDAAREARAFEELGAFTPPESFTVRGSGEASRVTASMVTPALIGMFRVEPIAGRILTPSDAAETATAGALISERLWHARFGGRPTLSRSITVDGAPYTIVGVMPASFAFPSAAVDVWVPIPDAYRRRSRSAHFLEVVGRLAPDVSLEKGTAVLSTSAARLEAQYPDTNRGWGISATTLEESIVGDLRRPLLVLLATVACVLLIACANVASLMLARGSARSRELAVRTALGASRARVGRQQLVESVIVALLGGAAGLALAALTLQYLRSRTVVDLPRLADVSLDLRVLAMTALVCIVTGLLTGVLPALSTARSNPSETLRGGHAAGGATAGRSRSVLVTAQIALATTLVIAAALLVMTFARLTRVDAGFQADRVVLAQVSLTVTRYDPQVWSSFFARTLEEIRRLPGVEAAGAVDPLPLSGQKGLMRFGVRFEGRPDPRPGEFDRTYLRRATPDYFSAIGIPVLDGRTFDAGDRADTKPVAVIDRPFADRYFPGQNPIGRKVRSTNDRTFREIVGVVGAVSQTSLAEPAEPHLYVAQSQNPVPAMTFVLRTGSSSAALAPALRAAVSRIDPEQPVFNIRTLRDIVSGSVASERFNALLLALFAQVALALALVGVYGLIAGWVAASTREIGVRVALGAGIGSVYRLVLGRGLRLACAGVVVGLLLALAATRFLGAMLFGVSAWDPSVFAGAAALVLIAALLAAWIPARRALAIDPAAALRAD
jgi:putative ABC transport system permease protein